MALELGLAITGRLGDHTRTIERAMKGATRTAVRRSTTKLKNRGRRQIKKAGLGERLANTLRDEVFPDEPSLSAKGRVFSKAIYRRPSGLADLLTVFEEGATIRARDGGRLAVGARRFHAGLRNDREAIAKMGTPGRRARSLVVRLAARLNLRELLSPVAGALEDSWTREYERRLSRGSR